MARFADRSTAKRRRAIVLAMIAAHEKRTGGAMELDIMLATLELAGHRWAYKTLRRVLDALVQEGQLHTRDHHVGAGGGAPMATWYWSA